MRNEFLKFGDRLRHLMDRDNIKNAYSLSEALYRSGIMKYSDNHKQTEKEKIAYTARSINLHLDKETPSGLSVEWLKRYCDFFHCSSDYLLGYISQTTHETTDIQEKTGLSENAINVLQHITQEQTDVLSDLLEHKSIGNLFQQITDLKDKEAVNESLADMIAMHVIKTGLQDKKTAPIHGNMIEKYMLYSINSIITNMICDVTDTEL